MGAALRDGGGSGCPVQRSAAASISRTSAAAIAALPQEPWDETTWSAWTQAVKETTGLKGKALFHPLRLALTGRESGPELAKLLPLIGRARTLARLSPP